MAEAIEEEAVAVAVIETMMAEVETIATINDSTTMIPALFMVDTNGENS